MSEKRDLNPIEPHEVENNPAFQKMLEVYYQGILAEALRGEQSGELPQDSVSFNPSSVNNAKIAETHEIIQQIDVQSGRSSEQDTVQPVHGGSGDEVPPVSTTSGKPLTVQFQSAIKKVAAKVKPDNIKLSKPKPEQNGTNGEKRKLERKWQTAEKDGAELLEYIKLLFTRLYTVQVYLDLRQWIDRDLENVAAIYNQQMVHIRSGYESSSEFTQKCKDLDELMALLLKYGRECIGSLTASNFTNHQEQLRKNLIETEEAMRQVVSDLEKYGKDSGYDSNYTPRPVHPSNFKHWLGGLEERRGSRRQSGTLTVSSEAGVVGKSSDKTAKIAEIRRRLEELSTDLNRPVDELSLPVVVSEEVPEQDTGQLSGSTVSREDEIDRNSVAYRLGSIVGKQKRRLRRQN